MNPCQGYDIKVTQLQSHPAQRRIPSRVAKKNSMSGTPTIGDVMLIKTLGNTGVILKKRMYQNKLLFLRCSSICIVCE